MSETVKKREKRGPAYSLSHYITDWSNGITFQEAAEKSKLRDFAQTAVKRVRGLANLKTQFRLSDGTIKLGQTFVGGMSAGEGTPEEPGMCASWDDFVAFITAKNPGLTVSKKPSDSEVILKGWPTESARSGKIDYTSLNLELNSIPTQE